MILWQSYGKMSLPPLQGPFTLSAKVRKQPGNSWRWGFIWDSPEVLPIPKKKFAPLWEAAKQVPDDRLLIETDSPFLVPHPLRGKLRRNEPLMTLYVARRLAELRGTTVEHIAAVTARNARALFAM